VKLARAALGRNPLQSTLIDSATMSIFGGQANRQDAERLSTQQERVEAIMADGYWHTLPQLQKELRQRWGTLHGEASISARLRDMRKRGWTVLRELTHVGSHLFQYRAVKVAKTEVAA
jgi:hypothetical protein